MELEKCKRGSSARENLKVPLKSGHLAFTFIPSFGRLPTQCYIADSSVFGETIAETKEFVKTPAKASGTSKAVSYFSSNNELLKEPKAKRKEMDGNGLFKAEFVFITDSDEDTPAILGNGYKHENSRIFTASYVPSGKESKRPGNVPQLSQDADLSDSSGSQQKHPQLTPPLSTSDHLSCKSSVAHFLSPTNLKADPELALPVLQGSAHSQWHSADGSCSRQTSTYFQSQTAASSSVPSSLLKRPLFSFNSLADNAWLAPNGQDDKRQKESNLSPPLLSKGSHAPLQLSRSAEALQASSPLPFNKLASWPAVPIYITTHILSPSPKPLSLSHHGSSSNVYSVNNPLSQMSSSGNLSVSGLKSPLPTRLSLLTAILKSGSSPKRPFSPVSCPATLSPNSLSSSTLAIEQKFKATPPTPKKSASPFPIRADSPCQGECRLSVISNVPSRMTYSRSSPTLQSWSRSPKKALDFRALSPDRLCTWSPTISSYRRTVVSPLLHPKLPTFSLPPHAPRKGAHSPAPKTRGPETSIRIHTCSPTFTARSCPVLTHAIGQREIGSPTTEKWSHPLLPRHSANQPKDHFDPDTHPSTPSQRTFSQQHSTSFTPPSCNIKSPLLQANPSPLHSNFRDCLPCSRHRTPTVTPCKSPARKHSPCSQLSRSRETSSPLVFSLPSDCQNKTPQTYKINASYKTLAAIPTNTLLLEQKALDEQTKREAETEDRALDTHSEMCSPAQLRQQTEEVCAVIDHVLQEPLTTPQCNSSPSPWGNIVDSKAIKTSKTSSQKPVGRETKFASLYSRAPAVIETQKMHIPPFLQELKEAYFQQPCKTKPGVIRPIKVKGKAIGEEEESVQPNPFRKYLEEKCDPQLIQPNHPIVPIPENEALSLKEISSVRINQKQLYQEHEELTKGNFPDNESPPC